MANRRAPLRPATAVVAAVLTALVVVAVLLPWWRFEWDQVLSGRGLLLVLAPLAFLAASLWWSRDCGFTALRWQSIAAVVVAVACGVAVAVTSVVALVVAGALGAALGWWGSRTAVARGRGPLTDEGDIWWGWLPFAESHEGKDRPLLVVRDRGGRHVLVRKITSQQPGPRHAHEFEPIARAGWDATRGSSWVEVAGQGTRLPRANLRRRAGRPR